MISGSMQSADKRLKKHPSASHLGSPLQSPWSFDKSSVLGSAPDQLNKDLWVWGQDNNISSKVSLSDFRGEKHQSGPDFTKNEIAKVNRSCPHSI